MRHKIATVLLSSLAACVLHLGASGETRGDTLLKGSTPYSNALVEAYNGAGTIFGYNEAPEGNFGNPASTSLTFTSMTGFTGTITGSMSNSITGNGTNNFTDQLNLSTSTTASNTDPSTSAEYTAFGEASVQMFVSVNTPSVATLTLPSLNLGTSTYNNMIGDQSQYLYGVLEVKSTNGSILYGSINGMTQDVNGTSSSSVTGYGGVLTGNSISLTLAPGNYELDGNAQAYVQFLSGANGSVTDQSTNGGAISITSVPEPPSLTLLGLASFGGFCWMRKRKENAGRTHQNCVAIS